jgi:hypothetical protein
MSSSTGLSSSAGMGGEAGEDILAQAAHWVAEGERVALATVVETWGSSPRPAGSRLAVTASGRLAGSVSGGCIEGAVADAAQETLAEQGFDNAAVMTGVLAEGAPKSAPYDAILIQGAVEEVPASVLEQALGHKFA